MDRKLNRSLAFSNIAGSDVPRLPDPKGPQSERVLIPMVFRFSWSSFLKSFSYKGP